MIGPQGSNPFGSDIGLAELASDVAAVLDAAATDIDLAAHVSNASDPHAAAGYAAAGDVAAAQADATQALADAAAAQATADAATALPTLGSRWGSRTARMSITELHGLADVADLVASPGDGTWANSGRVQTAEIIGSRIEWLGQATGSDKFESSSQSGPRYGWSLDPLQPCEIAARVHVLNATTVAFNYETVGVSIWNPEAPSNFLHARILYSSGWSVTGEGGGLSFGSTTINAATAEAGYWLRVRLANGRAMIERNTAAGTTYPTTGWASIGEGAIQSALLRGSTIMAGLYLTRHSGSGAPRVGWAGLRVMGAPLS
jgi:hypothetical protein